MAEHSGRATPPKPKENGEAKLTAERLLARVRPERAVTIDLDGEPVTLRLRAISRKDYDDLVQVHQPPDTDIDDPHARSRGWPFDVETFAPALIAACLIEPQLSLEEATQVWREWDTATVNELWTEALHVCTERPLRTTLGKESPTPSSSN